MCQRIFICDELEPDKRLGYCTGIDGSFTFYGIPLGQAYIRTDAQCNGGNSDLINEWYAVGGSTPDGNLASPVNITAGGMVNGINFQLDMGGGISGFVYQEDGVTPITGAWVYAMDQSFNYMNGGNNQADGSYLIQGLPEGSYYLAVQANGFGGVYYENGYDDPHAIPVKVTPPLITPDIDFHLSPEATFSGHVFQNDGVTPIEGATIQVWPMNGGQIRESHSAADGSFTVYGLSTGEYTAVARADGFEDEYYYNAAGWWSADPIQATQPENTPGINFTLTPVGTFPPDAERQVFMDFYNGTNGPNWTDATGWLGVNSACTWYGVYCHDGHVVEITLNYNKLSADIPSELGNLTSLEYLNLYRNELSGSIPPELGNLTSLQDLVLGMNQLSGSIPAELGNLTNLKELYLLGNQLIGGIPPELDNLTNLQYLLLGMNQLSGSIPAELANLTDLQYLYLSGNQLTGSIPAELGNLTNLQYLYLGANQLNGNIPAELGNLVNLQSLGLYMNQLRGSIPAELGNLSNLKYLYLETNQLNSNIPAELGNLVNLQSLGLYMNQLRGSIPPELGSLTNLQILWMQDNQLSGDIPSSFVNLVNLYDAGQYYGMDGLDLDSNLFNVPPGYPDPGDPLHVFCTQKDPDWQLYQGFQQLIGVLGGELTSLDDRTDVVVPTGALISDTVFTFIPFPAPRHASGLMAFAHHCFDLIAPDGAGTPATLFDLPFTITLTYADADIADLKIRLGLYHWESVASPWTDAVTTCPGGEYTRDLIGNTLSVPRSLTEFALFGIRCTSSCQWCVAEGFMLK